MMKYTSLCSNNAEVFHFHFLLNQIECVFCSPLPITKDDVALVTLYSKRAISGLL